MPDTIDPRAHTVTMTLTIGELGILDRALDRDRARWYDKSAEGAPVWGLHARIREALGAAMLSTIPRQAGAPE